MIYPVDSDLNGGKRYPPIEQLDTRRVKVVRRTVFFSLIEFVLIDMS